MIGASPANAAIVTTALTRTYSGKLALDALDLEVEAGSVFGFLGPNGAGKTTTIRLLLGFIRPTAGSATIFGRDCWSEGVRARQELGFLVQAESFYPDRRGAEQLGYAAKLSGRPPVLRRQILDALELSEADLDRRFGEYSKGMKQKLALTAAIQHDPQLLILDEPSDGLDPLIQRRFLQFLREFNLRGRTVFMSSHDLSEVEKVCDEVAIVKEGRLVARTTISDIRRRLLREVDVTFQDEPPDSLNAIEGVEMISRDGRRLVLSVEGPIDPLVKQLAQSSIVDLAIVPPSLDDVFMAYYDTPAWQRVVTEGRDTG